jgi:NADH:ubiquinone oxidoreductase subunit 6 (subunit J)
MLDLEAILFYGFAALAVVGALGVLLSRNIVRTAIWLLATLAAAAGMYFLLGAGFVGAIQLIIYAGGTLVLIIFGVMLTARNPRISFEPRPIEIVAGAVLCVVLAWLLIWTFLGTQWHQNPLAQAGSAGGTTMPVDNLPAEVKDRLTDLSPGADGTANIGKQLLSTYLVPFEITSLLLLAVLIGASYLARPRVPTSAKIVGEAPSTKEGAKP